MGAFLNYKKLNNAFGNDESQSMNAEGRGIASANPDLSSSFTSYTPSVSTGADTLKGYDSGGIDLGQAGVAGGAGGALGGPAGAAIAIGGSLASQYLAQQSADRRAKRERAQAIIKGQTDDEQQIISQIMQNNARALS